jgi:hypothetical protein
MIRGMVPKENLLEFKPGDGWEPLCKFLGKEIPDVEYPHANVGGQYRGRELQILEKWRTGATRNVGVAVGSLVTMGAVVYGVLRYASPA